jgi:hypothetical protein
MPDLSYPDALLTQQEVARVLGITVVGLTRWRVTYGADKIPYLKLGTGRRAPVRYRVRDVLAFIAAQEVTTGTNAERVARDEARMLSLRKRARDPKVAA